MGNENKAIRVGIFNEIDPSGTVMVPEADFVFAVVHSKDSDGEQVICQGCTNPQVVAASLLAAIDGVYEVMKEDMAVQALVMLGMTEKSRKEKRKGGDDDEQ